MAKMVVREVRGSLFDRVAVYYLGKCVCLVGKA